MYENVLVKYPMRNVILVKYSPSLVLLLLKRYLQMMKGCTICKPFKNTILL